MATELLSLRNGQSEAVAWRVDVNGHSHIWNVERNAQEDVQTRGGLVEPLYTHPAPQSEAVAVRALDIADDNDGIEQDAFEAWAKAERYDMHEHPMHWLFLDAKTAAARDGWRAGIRHSHARIRSALTHPAPPLAVTDEMVASLYAAVEGHIRTVQLPYGVEPQITNRLHSVIRTALTAALKAKQ
jgi:hypothetical protein